MLKCPDIKIAERLASQAMIIALGPTTQQAARPAAASAAMAATPWTLSAALPLPTPIATGGQDKLQPFFISLSNIYFFTADSDAAKCMFGHHVYKHIRARLEVIMDNFYYAGKLPSAPDPEMKFMARDKFSFYVHWMPGNVPAAPGKSSNAEKGFWIGKAPVDTGSCYLSVAPSLQHPLSIRWVRLLASAVSTISSPIRAGDLLLIACPLHMGFSKIRRFRARNPLWICSRSK